MAFAYTCMSNNGHLLIRYMPFRQIMTVADAGNSCACVPMNQW